MSPLWPAAFWPPSVFATKGLRSIIKGQCWNVMWVHLRKYQYHGIRLQVKLRLKRHRWHLQSTRGNHCDSPPAITIKHDLCCRLLRSWQMLHVWQLCETGFILYRKESDYYFFLSSSCMSFYSNLCLSTSFSPIMRSMHLFKPQLRLHYMRMTWLDTCDTTG